MIINTGTVTIINTGTITVAAITLYIISPSVWIYVKILLISVKILLSVLFMIMNTGTVTIINTGTVTVAAITPYKFRLRFGFMFENLTHLS
jgi:hypothetical protein